MTKPLPYAHFVTPDLVGSHDFTITVHGTGFEAGDLIVFHGAEKITSFVDESTLTAHIDTSDLPSAPQQLNVLVRRGEFRSRPAICTFDPASAPAAPKAGQSETKAGQSETKAGQSETGGQNQAEPTNHDVWPGKKDRHTK